MHRRNSEGTWSGSSPQHQNQADEVARRLILNTYKTLLTRGQKGCFVYCEDEGLRGYMKGLLPARGL